MKIPEVSLKVYKRAIRNVPWCLDIWCNYLRALEREHQPPVQVNPGYYQPGLASSGEVNIMRQPIMSSVAQPSNYLAQPPQYRTVQTVPVMVQYQPVQLPQYQQPCLATDTDIQVDCKYFLYYYGAVFSCNCSFRNHLWMNS